MWALYGGDGEVLLGEGARPLVSGSWWLWRPKGECDGAGGKGRPACCRCRLQNLRVLVQPLQLPNELALPPS